MKINYSGLFPVKRDVNGVVVFGTYASTDVGIRVAANIGGTVREDVYIVKQNLSILSRYNDVTTNITLECSDE